MRGSVEEWVESNFVPFFVENGIEVSRRAKEVLQLVLFAQVEEGLIESEDTLIRLADHVSPEPFFLVYLNKYGNRKLTANRMVRLLADFHDRWIEMRSNK